MPMKVCKKCGVEKDLDDYYRCKARKDGRQGRCKECAYNSRNFRASIHRNKVHVIEYKENNPCVICGESHVATLVFHHRDPTTKEFLISEGVASSSLKRLQAEIDKCDILCSNCHLKVHYSEAGLVRHS